MSSVPKSQHDDLQKRHENMRRNREREQRRCSKLEAALATAKIQISDLERRIRELELSLAAQKLEWEKAYDIGVTCKHSLAAEREVSDKLVTALGMALSKLGGVAWLPDAKKLLAEVSAIRAKQGKTE